MKNDKFGSSLILCEVKPSQLLIHPAHCGCDASLVHPTEHACGNRVATRVCLIRSPAHTHTRMLARTHGFSPSRGLRPRLGSKPVPHYACAADPIPAPGPLPWRRSSSQRHSHSLGPAHACLGRSVKHVLQEGWLSRKTLQRKRGSGCASPPLSPLHTPTLSLGHGSREASPTLGKSGVPPSPHGNHGVLLCYTGGTASAPPPHARFESGHGAWQSVRVERASYPHGRTRCFSPRHSAHSLFLRFPARAPTAPLPQPTPPHCRATSHPSCPRVPTTPCAV